MRYRAGLILGLAGALIGCGPKREVYIVPRPEYPEPAPIARDWEREAWQDSIRYSQGGKQAERPFLEYFGDGQERFSPEERRYYDALAGLAREQAESLRQDRRDRKAENFRRSLEDASEAFRGLADDSEEMGRARVEAAERLYGIRLWRQMEELDRLIRARSQGR